MTTLVEALRQEHGDMPPSLDGETIDRILTEPQQETLAEAVAADAVEAAPLVGDLLAIQRLERAKEEGIDYPDDPVFVQDATGDLPTPLDLIAESLVLYHTPDYLEKEYDIVLRNPPKDAAQRLARVVGDVARTQPD